MIGLLSEGFCVWRISGAVAAVFTYFFWFYVTLIILTER